MLDPLGTIDAGYNTQENIFNFLNFGHHLGILTEIGNVNYLENCLRYSNFELMLDPLGTTDPEYNAYKQFLFSDFQI